jgi:hypothetical protein
MSLFRPPADRRRQHEHVRKSANLGLGLEVIRQRERRPLEFGLPAEVDLALRGQTISTSTRR